MGKITQYSRLSHHTISGSASAGKTFSVPTSSEDFTDGTWTDYDLALSEIGVNEEDKKVYIRINDEIIEFQTVGATSGGETLAQTLLSGNTTDGTNIQITNGSQITSTSSIIISATSYVNIDTLENDLNCNLGVDASSGYITLTSQQDAVGFNEVYFNSAEFYIRRYNLVDAAYNNTVSIDNTTGITLQSNDTITGEYGVANVKKDKVKFQLDNFNVSPFISIEYDFTQTSEGLIILDASGKAKIVNNSEGLEIGENVLSLGGPVIYKLGEVQTTNNTITTAALIDYSGEVDSVITIEAIVQGWGATNSLAYGAQLFATFKNVGGTTALIGTVDLNEKTEFTTATSDIEITSNDIIITVEGENSTNINWIVRYNYQISK